VSLFDENLEKQNIVRSNQRRHAVIIPKKLGAEMTKKINDAIIKEDPSKTLEIKSNFEFA
jgi:hypothetical protein